MHPRQHEPEGESTSPAFGLHTFAIALRRWWAIATPIGLALAIAAAFGVAYFVKPKYTASAWISIRARPEHLLSAANLDDPQKFVQNQLELMKSPQILAPIANDPQIASIPELVGEVDNTQALRKQLKIHAQGQSEYYVLDFTSVDAEGAALVVNTVVDKYYEYQRGQESSRVERTLELLRKQQAQQQDIVKSFRRSVSELSKQLTGDDPFLAKAGAAGLETRNPAAEIKAQLVAGEVEHEFLKAEVQAETEMLEQQETDVPQSAIDQYVDNNPQVAAILSRIELNKAKERAHVQNSANLPNNALYQRVQKQLSDDQAALTTLKKDLSKQARLDLEKQVRSAKQDTVAAMQRKVARSAFAIDFLREKLKSEIAGQKEFKGDLLQLEFLRADYDRAVLVYDQMAARISGVSMEQNAPERVIKVKAAAAPTHPDEALPYKKMGMMAMGAFCLPFLCAVGAEYLFRRVSTRTQLESSGKLMVIGEVTELPRKSRAISRRGRAKREVKIFEESVDGLWMFLALSDTVRTIAVTSAISGEGKTSLAVQLAISIASTTRSRTLLIDGDMRSPDVHRLFEVECGPGLVDVLSGEAELDDAIESDFSDQLHILTAGRTTTSPCRLLQGDDFPVLLERLKEKYDYIVIDTPPILAASESLLIARSVDTALLCVRRDFSRISQVEEASWRLKAAKAKTAGAVLSGIPVRSYARRYGEYYCSEALDLVAE